MLIVKERKQRERGGAHSIFLQGKAKSTMLFSCHFIKIILISDHKFQVSSFFDEIKEFRIRIEIRCWNLPKKSRARAGHLNRAPACAHI